VPLVSVYMAAWNRERFIAEAIESVLGQDFEDLELIIVDDGSIDATRQIIERYARQDPRIRVIFHERNGWQTDIALHGLAKSGEGSCLQLLSHPSKRGFYP